MENKDWLGNSKSVYSTLGASSHSDYERANQSLFSIFVLSFYLKYFYSSSN